MDFIKRKKKEITKRNEITLSDTEIMSHVYISRYNLSISTKQKHMTTIIIRMLMFIHINVLHLQ